VCQLEKRELAFLFQSEKELLWDSIKADLEEKIHKLEEDKNNVDFSTGLWEQTSRYPTPFGTQSVQIL
jgi:breast cancer metastasis-suppressor 1-like protein